MEDGNGIPFQRSRVDISKLWKLVPVFRLRLDFTNTFQKYVAVTAPGYSYLT